MKLQCLILEEALHIPSDFLLESYDSIIGNREGSTMICLQNTRESSLTILFIS